MIGPHERISSQRSRPIKCSIFCAAEKCRQPRKIGDARHVWEGDDASILSASAKFALSL